MPVVKLFSSKNSAPTSTRVTPADTLRCITLPRAATPAYPAIQTAMSDAINAIARGEDVQATLDAAVDTIDSYIETLNQ